MTGPPGAIRLASAPLNEQGGSHTAMTPAQRVSALIKEARRYRQLDRISNTRLSRLVNAYVSQEIELDLVGYIVGYADPTGETAAYNVDRERRAS